jgi:hypothetical protein
MARRVNQPAPQVRERKHAVRAALSVPELTKAGTSLKLEISQAGEKIGELQIGRGGFFWKRGKGKKSRRLSWARFVDIMHAE